jgi:hypothetical protein
MREPVPGPPPVSRSARLDGRRRGALSRFFGDTPLRSLVKLALISVLVGWVMESFGWSPADVFYALGDSIHDLWAMGLSALDGLLGYLLLGAAVVVPAFVVLRLLSLRR